MDWIAAFVEKKEKQESVERAKEKWKELEKQESKLLEIKKQKQNRKRKRDKSEDEFEKLLKDAQTVNKDQEVKGEGQEESQVDEDLVPEDYHSDDEVRKEEESDEEGVSDEGSHVTKIYYCSRTHSQLAQFVREIIKSPYGSNTRVLSLGSRQNLCVNDAVRKLNSLSLMNDMCLDLQKNKSKGTEKKESDEAVQKKRKKLGSNGCPFYKQETMEDLGNQILTEVTDMEQIVISGKDFQIRLLRIVKAVKQDSRCSFVSSSPIKGTCSPPLKCFQKVLYFYR